MIAWLEPETVYQIGQSRCRKCDTAPPIDRTHRYCADSPDVLHVRVKGRLELRMFDSREHAAEYLLVLALPYLYNLVISTYSTATVPVPVQYSQGIQYSTGAVRGKICSAVFRPKCVCNTPLGLSNANTLADTPKSKMLPLIIIFYSLYSVVNIDLQYS